MIKLIDDWLHGLLDIAEVNNPAEVVVERTTGANDHAEGMTMKPCAFVLGWDIRKAVRSLKRELCKYFHLIYRAVRSEQ